MAITDLEAIRFSNEQVRPYCEKMRNMYWEFKSLAIYWNDVMAAMIPNDEAEVLEDDRPEDTDLTGADIRAFVAQAALFIQAMEEAGVLSAIQKPCVRHLEAN